jgi:hypothetical protein
MKLALIPLTIWFVSAASTILGQVSSIVFSTNSVPAGSGPRSLVLIDLNRDRIRNLAVANLFDSTISLITGGASGSFTLQENFAFTTDAPHAIAISDVDENGILDLLTANRDSDTVGIFLGDGVGGVMDPTFFSTGQGPRWIAVADLFRTSMTI